MHNLARILITSLALSFVAPATAGAMERVETNQRFELADAELDGKLNVNDASTDQWELLPGIGPATAAKLVAYRQKKPFADISHVMRIKGIGRKTFNRIKPYLTTRGETTLVKPGKRKKGERPS